MLDVGLKEWAVVCELLLSGELAFLLRKGGIHESGGPGVFELEHPRFALFPAWEHQKPAMLKAAYRDRVSAQPDPAVIPIHGLAEAARVWTVPGRGALQRLDDLHPWSEAQIDMRLGYKPDRPLYLVAIRAYRLAEPASVANSAEYAGCRSWVPLRPGDAIDDAGARAVLDDAAMQRVIDRIDAAVSGG